MRPAPLRATRRLRSARRKENDTTKTKRKENDRGGAATVQDFWANDNGAWEGGRKDDSQKENDTL